MLCTPSSSGGTGRIATYSYTHPIFAEKPWQVKDYEVVETEKGVS
jgi:hypothetical protein